MAKNDRTDIGGPNEAFLQTQWTDILDARTQDTVRRREAVGRIVGQYWKPVYAYLRRKGNRNEEAKDLTQGFFEEIVLKRHLLRQADQRKGRFRTYLLTALDHYVISVHRARTARKRRPAAGLVRLDGLDAASLPDPVHEATPERAFAYAWACELLEEVLSSVEAACKTQGLQTHWEVFRRTVVLPNLQQTTVPHLSEICSELGIESVTKASNMSTTVKRRFRAALRVRIRRHVRSDGEVETEIRDLMQILSSSGAGSPPDRRIT